MASTNFQQVLLAELEAAWSPLKLAAESPAHFSALLAELGWIDVPTSPMPRAAAFASLNTTVALIAMIRDLVENPPETLADVVGVIEDAQGVGAGLVRLLQTGQELDPSGALPAVATLGEDLFSYLWGRYLERQHPTVYWSLVLVGLLDEGLAEPEALLDADGVVCAYRFGWPKARFDNLGELFSDPVGLWKGRYLPGGVWPTTEAEAIGVGQRLFPPLAGLLRSLGVFARWGNPPGALQDPAVPADSADHTLVFWYEFEGVSMGATVTIDPARGVVVTPFGGFQFTQAFAAWELVVSLIGTVGSFAISGAGVSFDADPTLLVEALLTRTPGPDSDVAFLIGSATGTRLEIGQFEVGAFVDLQVGDSDGGVHAMARQSAMVIATGDGDGFLSKILPPEGIRIGFELGLGFSKRRGVYFEGGVGEGFALVLKIPIRQRLFGVLTFEDVRLTLRPDTSPVGISAELGGTIITELGPLVATVENMGLALVVEADPQGNLGPVALRLRFKPPSGIGLVVSSPAVTGGGYLSFGDRRYTGILQLRILSRIGVTAIAILTTELPGGEPGFSLFILIAIEFDPGIQLGMGFSLTGVGGLLGLNRGMDPEALRAGVRGGALGAILFPRDALAQAAEIISSIESFFPVQKDRFVFGPMFRVAWGSPAIVTLELGLVIEVPAPVRIAIPGVLRMALPKPASPVLALNVAFIGIVDFGKKFISIDASLFDSKLLTFTLEGDMALRLCWGANPLFIYAMGGFHPSFPVPTGLGLEGMKRLTLNMINRPQLRLTFDTYLAVTSNTVQFGSRAQLYVGFGIGSIEGVGGFDAIFYFNPFRMDVAVYFAAALVIGNMDVLAIGLSAQLTGPTPWHIVGEASFTFLGTEYAVAVDKTWGETADTSLPSVQVTPLLLAALDDRDSWSAGADADDDGQVVVRATSALPEAERLLLHPRGALRVEQRVVPLDTTLDHFSNQPIEGDRSFSILAVEVVGPGGPVSMGSLQTLKTGFARAQYQELSVVDKLTSPSFVDLPSGVQVQIPGGGVAVGSARSRAVAFETYLIDRPGGPLDAVGTATNGTVAPSLVSRPPRQRQGLSLAATIGGAR